MQFTESNVDLIHFLVLGAIIFSIGLYGVFSNRKNIIIVFISIELMLLAININLVSFSVFLKDLTGQIFTMFILVIAVAEVAVGLAILVAYYRAKGDIDINKMNQMQG
jgi:NADH-quinone oxidoreductase subunit K